MRRTQNPSKFPNHHVPIEKHYRPPIAYIRQSMTYVAPKIPPKFPITTYILQNNPSKLPNDHPSIEKIRPLRITHAKSLSTTMWPQPQILNPSKFPNHHLSIDKYLRPEPADHSESAQPELGASNLNCLPSLGHIWEKHLRNILGVRLWNQF